MRHILAIARRELRSYFVSPIAYAALTAFALLSGYFFNSMVVYYVRQASLADRQIEQLGRSDLQLDVPTVILEEFFKNQGSFVILLIVPLLTMGLITDERRKGTLELLLTSPVRPIELTVGKFLGALALFVLMCLPTLPYWYFLAQGGDWEPGVVLAGYTGLLLLAATQIAIGLFISSLSENVLVSALCTYGVLVALNFIDTSASMTRSIWVDFIQFLSFHFHNAEFARGVVALRNITYFAGFLALALFLTQRSIEAIRFKRS
jgi:gliding motility-associated transport system permease protein